MQSIQSVSDIPPTPTYVRETQFPNGTFPRPKHRIPASITEQTHKMTFTL